jgi:hypothetical protein
LRKLWAGDGHVHSGLQSRTPGETKWLIRHRHSHVTIWKRRSSNDAGNEEFHKEFIADPAGAFTKYLDVPAASQPKIVVHEKPAGSWHIVLTAKPANASELSDRELETVVGASAIISVVASSVVTVSTWTAATATVEIGW